MLPTTAMSFASDDNLSSSKHYVEQHRLDELFKELMVALLVEQPDNPASFLATYLSSRTDTYKTDYQNTTTSRQACDEASPELESHPADYSLSDSDSSEEEEQASGPYGQLSPVGLTQRFRMAHGAEDVPFRYGRRGSVSAESLALTDDDGDERTIIPKSDQARMRITLAITSNLLFRNLDSEQRRHVVDAMFERKVAAGENIIVQGEEGDNFYVVDEGMFDIFVNGNKVVDVGPSGSFGELALMYNTPRAATVQATEDSILWGVDRVTFRRSITGYSFRKRKMYTSFLQTVPILAKLLPAEVTKLADALEPVTYDDGDCIIEQGDDGTHFYLIEQGKVDVSKVNEDGAQLILPSLAVGDYFGELALIHNKPRAATVTAKGEVRVAALAKDAFVRLLGPAVTVMKRRTMTYGQFDRQALEAMLRNNGQLDSNDEAAAS